MSSSAPELKAYRPNLHFLLRPVPILRGPPRPAHFVSKPEAMTAPLPSKPFPFFKLSGELRNKIYNLVVDEARVVVVGSHPEKELVRRRKEDSTRRHKQPRYRLTGTYSKNGPNRSLLLTCKQMNSEAVQLIYARTTFIFSTMKSINKFLNIIPQAGAQNIEHLEVIHRGYAEPQWTADRIWKLRHDAVWNLTLTRIRENLTSLQSFSLDMTFFDWPCQLDLTSPWANTLIKFASDGLDKVKLVLEHDRFSQEKLQEIARQLEKKMMTPEGILKEIREAKRRAEEEKLRREQASRKAKKALTIRISEPQEQRAARVPVRKMVRTKGLERFAKAEPAVAYCPPSNSEWH